jgi:hypothetical protein
MSSGSIFLLATFSVLFMCLAVSAYSKRPVDAWNYYHFDGQVFVAGQPADGVPFVAVRDRTLPVVMTRMSRIEPVPLPAEQGALAVITYIQSSTGRLTAGRGYTPSPGITVTISSGGQTVSSVVSDENGYFVATLAAGSYRITSGSFSAEATLVNGTTTLVPLRTGKRMVD